MSRIFLSERPPCSSSRLAGRQPSLDESSLCLCTVQKSTWVILNFLNTSICASKCNVTNKKGKFIALLGSELAGSPRLTRPSLRAVPQGDPVGHGQAQV